MRIKNAIKRFSDFKVAVIGDLILDEYIFGTAERISPEAPVPVVLQNRREVRPGGAANVAFNLVELGAKVVLFGVVGDDPFANELKSILESSGIDTSGIVKDPKRPTTVKTRIIAHRQQVVRLDRESTDPIDSNVRDRMLDRISELIDGIDAVIFEDYNKGALSEEMIERGIAAFSGKLRAVDPKFQNFWNYRGVELFKPNRKELANAMLRQFYNTSDFMNSIREAHDRLETQNLLVTAGEDGMYLSNSDGIVHIPAHKRDVFDVTGAGDTVIAVAVLGMLAGLPVSEAALLASIAAGIEVSKLGAATVSPDELMQAVDDHWDELYGQIEVL